MMLSGVRVAVRKHIAPGSAKGIENRMANGWAIRLEQRRHRQGDEHEGQDEVVSI